MPKRKTTKKNIKKNKVKINNKNSININIDNSRKTTGWKSTAKFKHPQLYTPNYFPNSQPQIIYQNPQQTGELTNKQNELIEKQKEHANLLNVINKKVDDNLLGYDPNFKNDITNKLDNINTDNQNRYSEITSGVNNLYDNVSNVFNRLNNYQMKC